MFYVAVQTRTWGRPHHIRATKDFIERQEISTIDFIARDPEPVDVDNILGANDPKMTRVPKAGQGLVSYNPTEAAEEAEVGDIIGVDNNIDAAPVLGGGARRQEVNGPIAGEAFDLSVLDDDALENEIGRLQRLLQERKTRKLKAQFQAEAEQGKIIGGDVWPDRGQWATVVIEFSNGNEVTYYHQQLMEDKKADDCADGLLDSLID